MNQNFTLKICLLFCLLGTSSIFAQKATITGKVTDASTGETLIGATIIVKNTRSGTITDINGTYTIPAEKNDILVCTYAGYVEQSIAIDNRTTIDIALEQTESQLQELVVVGYGVQRKSQLTGAIASISNKDFKDQPVSNLANSVQGRVTGLNVSTPSGTPGAGLLVSIRGNNAPLYVVDGIPLIAESNSALSTSFNTSGETVGQGQTLSSVSDINPNDIESIEILKDASAAAIYGARAANGVILITTKRGKSGASEVSLNYYTGVQRVARPIKFMSSDEWVSLIEEGRKNDLDKYNQDPAYFGDDFDPALLTDPLVGFDQTGVNTNWLNEVTRTAPISNYEMSMRGGNDKTRFFTSAGFYDQKGVVIENFYKRFTYRLNLDHKINEKLNIGTTINTSFSRNRRSFNDDTYTGIITNALGASPLMPVYEQDGSYANFANYQVSWLSDNPVKSAKEIRAYTNVYRVLGSVFADYSILPALKFRSTFSTDASFLFDTQFKSPITTDGEPIGGEAFESNFRNITWLNENTLNFHKELGKNSLDLLGGVSFQNTDIQLATATGQGFPPGGLERVSSAANIVNATSAGGGFGLVSFIGRVNYGFKDRYLLTGSFRSDGSSRFSQNNRFGVFPSAALAWRLSSEPFMQSNKLFSDLKLRVSYGLTGDQEIGDFQNVTFYSASRYDGLPGLQLRNLADPNLSWQSNRSFNTGIDYEIKGGRFAGALEFFQATKTRLLSEDIIQGTTGFSTVTRNSGEVQNMGVEFNIRAVAVRKKDFRWDVNFNTTWIKNEIKKLSSDGVYLNAYSDLESTHILKVGQPLGSFIGLKFTGIDPQTGDATFEDTNGDGLIDYDDAQIIGKAMPDFFGGITNSFTWKNVDLSIFTRFTQGNDVYNLIRSTTETLGYGNDGGLSSVYANNTVNVRNRWKKPGDVAEYGRASFIYANYYQNSSQMLEDGSFIRIQNVTLGYTFPGKRMNGSRIYFEGQNLYLFSKYKGFDPEVSSNGGLSDRTAGVDYGAYPQARTLLVGFNVKF